MLIFVAVMLLKFDDHYWGFDLTYQIKLLRLMFLIPALLSIKAEKDMGDDVWHEVADSLGYTPREISNLNSCDNPMAAVIADYKRRGGMPHQFIAALYKTGSPGNMTKQHMSKRSETARVMDEERSGEFT